MVNERETKYLMVTRRNRQTRPLEVHNYNFEKVVNFKYFGVKINENTDSHEEIKLRLKAAKKCYFGLIPLFNSNILS